MQFLYYQETVSLSNSSPNIFRLCTAPAHPPIPGASQGAMAPPPDFLVGMETSQEMWICGPPLLKH